MEHAPSATKSNRRKIIAGVAALGVAAAGYGVYASALTVDNSNSFAAGTGTVASGCDTTVDTLLVVATTPPPAPSLQRSHRQRRRHDGL